jgi:hypothetical protein
MTLMIFMLIMLDAGGNKTGVELAFQELTSCLEYRDALVMQSTHIHNYVVGRKTSKFDAYCEVRLIPASEAGKGNYIFRDPTIKKDDD